MPGMRPETDFDEFTLISAWLFMHPDMQQAYGGIYHVFNEGIGLDLHAIYDEDAAAHDVLEGAGICPGHTGYQSLREAIADIVSISIENSSEIKEERRARLKTISVTSGRIITQQNIK